MSQIAVPIKPKKYFESELIAYLSASGEPATSKDGRLRVRVARYYGFCHGVIRAIRIALDTADSHPGRRIFLLGQMIHNPYVNAQLQKRGVVILPGADLSHLAGITAQDVAIVPAFGIALAAMERLRALGCGLADTTCGEVMSIWKRIGRYNSAGFTTVIHGKYTHQETIATSSRATKYIVVKDLQQAALLAGYIACPSPERAATVLDGLKGAYSDAFDPAADLQRVGMAAQTTMYANEFIAVSDLIREAVKQRVGAEALEQHFQELDTICSATQERQDAVNQLAGQCDVLIVVGGYNSSNTASLTRGALEFGPAYHIEGPGRISAGAIRHQPLGTKEEAVTQDWLPEKDEIIVGVTSGASTPDSIVHQVLDEILAIGGGMEAA